MTPLRRDVLLSASSSSVPFAELGDTCANASIAPTEGIEALPSADVTETFGYAVKSVLDRIGACVLLLLLLPLMILIASVIRLESRGPALFAQERVGFRQQRFRCYKFRSMYHHMGDAQAILQTTRGDVRVTPFGRVLRRSSLDELPQLLNVAKGDMSLVGPRPHAPETRAAGRLFTEIVQSYDRRHCVRPGITGWAQVNGWRGETRCAEDIEMRVRYDLEYIYNWSLVFDLRIMLLTLVRMVNDDTAV
jgi:lipopolysaccharide/colanic/teichoic acid biosynthesis glycosyltransferase